MVLAVDEKPQRQALERTQRGLPVTAGHAATHTHDYRRHGTLSLFAGLDIHTGQVYYACQARHRHQACLAFLRPRARRFPTQTVHLVLDNYAIHKHQKVQAWRDAHPRFHFHFIPTYSSWLNMVEHVFSAFQRQVRAQGSFAGKKMLQAAIARYVRSRNQHRQPPRWRATADSILGQLEHIHRTYGTVH